MPTHITHLLDAFHDAKFCPEVCVYLASPLSKYLRDKYDKETKGNIVFCT